MQLRNPKLLHGKSYIDGQFIAANDKKTFAVTNPYDGTNILEVADCGQTETRLAIEKANEAFQSWRQLTGTERGQILRRWYELQLKNLQDM